MDNYGVLLLYQRKCHSLQGIHEYTRHKPVQVGIPIFLKKATGRVKGCVMKRSWCIDGTSNLVPFPSQGAAKQGI